MDRAAGTCVSHKSRLSLLGRPPSAARPFDDDRDFSALDLISSSTHLHLSAAFLIVPAIPHHCNSFLQLSLLFRYSIVYLLFKHESVAGQ
jgi:hypothetical protein